MSDEEIKLEGRVALLQLSPLFRGMTKPDHEVIAARATGVIYARDERVFLQGQNFRSLVLIRSGSVKITQLSSQGSEVLLRMHGTGSTLGMFSSSPVDQNSCHAVEESTALMWNHATFQDLKEKFPQIERNANQIFSTQLAELEERFREVSTEKVNKRLALILLRLITNVGRKVGTGIEISLSREELAQMIGTTLFTVSRVISQWACKGVVIPGRNLITVCSLPLLELEILS
jgi:CRP/FNR family transcriptional regulator, nitrogen oxide reductase regulator